MDPMPGCDIRLVFTVHCSTQDAYTSEITFLALKPCLDLSVQSNELEIHTLKCKLLN